MLGILITALDNQEENINNIIHQLLTKGYQTEDISLITKSKEEWDFPADKKGLTQVLAKAQIFPQMGGLLVGGPLASALNLISLMGDDASPKDKKRLLILSASLTNIGVPQEDADYFSDIVSQGGFILVLPEFDQIDIYELLWSYGARRIVVLEEDSQLENSM